MHLFDHNTPSWRQYPNLVTGAITYSEDIIKFQLPHWESILGIHDVLSTAPPLDTIELPSKTNNIVVYLHTWPYSEETLRIEKYSKGLKRKLLLISAYKPYVETLRKKGFRAVYIPMSIDIEHIKQYQQTKYEHGRIVYYGNVSNYKRKLLKEIKETCENLGLELDIVSWNIFEKKKITHEESLRLISTYNYGIGVGRCALELMAFGVKQVIAGRAVGGLITNEEEFELQREVNMNGRIYTYSDNLSTCLLNIDKAICINPPMLNHVEEVLKIYPELDINRC